MTRAYARTPRLFASGPIEPGIEFDLARDQAHYLVNVMRLKPGDHVRLFNGNDGEWLCGITSANKRQVTVSCVEKLANPDQLPDLDYLFAPLKHARLDYMVQKATELGAARLKPVFTDNCIVSRVNMERMRANVIEAAEQCNLVAVPDVLEPARLSNVLDGWPGSRPLIFCDEGADKGNPADVLQQLGSGPLAVLIGPEGGFSEAERERLRAMPEIVVLSLGPRIMRADTAAIAALSLVQATLGDWR